jgi:putative aldouronate transport system substrate-binding protein
VRRRGLLRAWGIGAFAVGLSVPTLEAACAPSRPLGLPTSAAGAGSPVKLPSYIPLQAAKADLPSPMPGVDPGYLTYPANPFKATQETPGRGGQLNVVTWQFTPLPTPMDSNAAWQAINQRAGTTIKLNIVPIADYPAKQATIMASDDLPDVMYFSNTNVPGLPAFLQAKCADLAPYLSGDAIKDYPNLANIPTESWKVTVFGQSIFGVPLPYSVVFRQLWTHQLWLDQIGSEFPRDTEDFRRILKLMANPGANRWGVASDSGVGLGMTIQFQPMLFGAPNNWKVDPSGKLIRERETDEYKAALGFTRDLWEAGVFHPDSINYNNANGKRDYAAGKFAFRWDGHSASLQFWDNAAAANPSQKLRIAPPFGAPGVKPTFALGGGNFGFNIIKQASPERIKEILRILNFFASPFGSEEHMLANYGVKDVDYTLDANGNPVLTQQGQQDYSTAWIFLARPPEVLYDANAPDFARTVQADQAPYIQVGITDPTYGLFSPTAAAGAAIESTFTAGVDDIVFGRRPLTDLDQLVKDWRAQGGDKMRAEYEQLLVAKR